MLKEWHMVRTLEMDGENCISISRTLDTTGLLCPELMTDVVRTVHKLKVGQVMEVFATDSATKNYIHSWCRNTGHELLNSYFNAKSYKYYYLIKRVRHSF